MNIKVNKEKITLSTKTNNEIKFNNFDNLGDLSDKLKSSIYNTKN